jgi:hypothetical protein
MLLKIIFLISIFQEDCDAKKLLKVPPILLKNISCIWNEKVVYPNVSCTLKPENRFSNLLKIYLIPKKPLDNILV